METSKRIILLFSIIVSLLYLCISCNKPTTIEHQDVIKYDTIASQYGMWGAEIYHISFNEGELNARVVLQAYDFMYDDSIPYGSYQMDVIAHPQDSLLPLGTYTTSNTTPLYINKQGCSFAYPRRIAIGEQLRTYRYKDVTMSIKRDATTGDYYVEAFIQMLTGENHYIRSSFMARVYIDEVTRFPIGYSHNYYPE